MKTMLIFALTALFGLTSSTTSLAEIVKEEWVCYSSNNYRGSKKMIRSGEYQNCSRWRYNSWKTSCAVKLIYYKKNGQKGEQILQGDVRDLRDQMRRWSGLKYGANAGWRNVHKAIFYCDGPSDKPTKPTGPTAGNTGNYHKYISMGHCVAWNAANYRQQFVSYQPGKKYYPRTLKFNFSSFKLPKDYLVMFTYRSKNGRSKKYECKTDIRDMKYVANTWDIRDKRNPWGAIQYFEIKRISKPNNSDGNAQKAYLGKEWYNRYKTGYVVFSERKYYDGDYEAKANGDYDYRKLGFHPLSIYVPKANRYIIMEYKAKNGRIKSEVIKKSIDDLDRYLYHLGVHKNYKKTPYKAVKRFAVIRQ